jgi:hypothetical protein
VKFDSDVDYRAPYVHRVQLYASGPADVRQVPTEHRMALSRCVILPFLQVERFTGTRYMSDLVHTKSTGLENDKMHSVQRYLLRGQERKKSSHDSRS